MMIKECSQLIQQKHAYGTSKDIIHVKEKFKCYNTIKRCLTLTMSQKKTKNHPNWPEIPDHPYQILMIGGSGSRKTNAIT